MLYWHDRWFPSNTRPCKLVSVLQSIPVFTSLIVGLASFGLGTDPTWGCTFCSAKPMSKECATNVSAQYPLICLHTLPAETDQAGAEPSICLSLPREAGVLGRQCRQPRPLTKEILNCGCLEDQRGKVRTNSLPSPRVFLCFYSPPHLHHHTHLPLSPPRLPPTAGPQSPHPLSLC